MPYNHETTWNTVLQDIELDGKTALITGASSGLGAETAYALASKGCDLILLARDANKLQIQAERIKADFCGVNITSYLCDLADLNAIKACAETINKNTAKIDIMINNAGIMACPLMQTSQGLEMQFGVNHLGHFYLTQLLSDLLLAAAPARLVVLSSGGHKYGCIDLDDPNWQQREYDKWLAYGAAKTANALFAYEFNKRFAPLGVNANAVHPGVIFTELARHLTAEDYEMLSGSSDSKGKDGEEMQGRRGKLIIKPVEAGAATSVWAATHPDLEGRGGLYLEDCHVATEANADDQNQGYFDYIMNDELAKQLWQRSEKMIADLVDA